MGKAADTKRPVRIDLFSVFSTHFVSRYERGDTKWGTKCRSVDGTASFTIVSQYDAAPKASSLGLLIWGGRIVRIGFISSRGSRGDTNSFTRRAYLAIFGSVDRLSGRHP
jgi:hypothetical protein